MTRFVDLFKAATLDDMRAAGFVAFYDGGEIVVEDNHKHALTQREDGWFLRLIDPLDTRVAELRALGWADAPRQVWA